MGAQLWVVHQGGLRGIGREPLGGQVGGALFQTVSQPSAIFFLAPWSCTAAVPGTLSEAMPA